MVEDEQYGQDSTIKAVCWTFKENRPYVLQVAYLLLLILFSLSKRLFSAGIFIDLYSWLYKRGLGGAKSSSISGKRLNSFLLFCVILK